MVVGDDVGRFPVFFSWILMPIGVSLMLLPDFHGFYASMGWPLLLRVALFGALWGVGGITYGLTIRHLGLSLGIGMAIGLTLIVGTLLPPLVQGQGAMLFATRSGLFSMAGVLVAMIGVATVSWAGASERGAAEGESWKSSTSRSASAWPFCAASRPSGMSFGIAAAKPMEQVALHLGVNPLYAALPAYVLIMGGGSLVNWGYCSFRIADATADIAACGPLPARRRACTQHRDRGAGRRPCGTCSSFSMPGAHRIFRSGFSYVNWTLHMSMYVLCGGLVGLVLGEWAGVGSRPLRLLWAGILVIIAAANLVGLGMAAV